MFLVYCREVISNKWSTVNFLYWSERTMVHCTLVDACGVKKSAILPSVCKVVPHHLLIKPTFICKSFLIFRIWGRSIAHSLLYTDFPAKKNLVYDHLHCFLCVWVHISRCHKCQCSWHIYKCAHINQYQKLLSFDGWWIRNGFWNHALWNLFLSVI